MSSYLVARARAHPLPFAGASQRARLPRPRRRPAPGRAQLRQLPLAPVRPLLVEHRRAAPPLPAKRPHSRCLPPPGRLRSNRHDHAHRSDELVPRPPPRRERAYSARGSAETLPGRWRCSRFRWWSRRCSASSASAASSGSRPVSRCHRRAGRPGLWWGMRTWVLAILLGACGSDGSSGTPDARALPDADPDALRVAGTYPTAVSLGQSDCTGITVQSMPTAGEPCAGGDRPQPHPRRSDLLGDGGPRRDVRDHAASGRHRRGAPHLDHRRPVLDDRLRGHGRRVRQRERRSPVRLRRQLGRHQDGGLPT